MWGKLRVPTESFSFYVQVENNIIQKKFNISISTFVRNGHVKSSENKSQQASKV